MDPYVVLILLMALLLPALLLDLNSRLSQGEPAPEVDPMAAGPPTHAPPPVPVARPAPAPRPAPVAGPAQPSARPRYRDRVLPERGPARLREARRGIILLTVLGPCRALEPSSPGGPGRDVAAARRRREQP